MKYINFKRYKFSTALKTLNKARYNFFKILRSIFSPLKKYEYNKIHEYFEFRKFNIKKIRKYINLIFYYFRFFNIKAFTRYLNIKFFKKVNLKNSKFLLFHLPASLIFFIFLYITIPTFYNYDKSDIAKALCGNYKIKCFIKGEVNYRFYPTPRLNIKNLVVTGNKNQENPFLIVGKTEIKLSIKNLLAKDRHEIRKIEIENFETNLNLKNLKENNNILNKKINLPPINFKKGKIIFYQGADYVATISKAKSSIKFVKGFLDMKLKGNFLNDNISIYLSKNAIDKKISTNFKLKMSNLNLISKINFFSSQIEKNVISGNFSVNKNKNKISGIFDYKDNELIINKSNLRNAFIDGKLDGKIIFSPYFNFNLDLNLNSLNFTKINNYFLNFDKDKRKKLFNLNNKINGKLNFSSNKIYSKHNLVKSFESRLKFYNGNLNIEQFLVNLGNLGAADLIGNINEDKVLTNLKFESNIFVDNQKKFLSKFGIYNKSSISSNYFVSGMFDLENVKATFYEISDDKKFTIEDTNYIEKEFNNLMLENEYKYLFDFPRLKEFIKVIKTEEN